MEFVKLAEKGSITIYRSKYKRILNEIKMRNLIHNIRIVM